MIPLDGWIMGDFMYFIKFLQTSIYSFHIISNSSYTILKKKISHRGNHWQILLCV